MTRCNVLVRRIPHRLSGEPVEEHAFLAMCGRPVEADGMCPYHLKQHKRDLIKERKRWRLVARLRGR